MRSRFGGLKTVRSKSNSVFLIAKQQFPSPSLLVTLIPAEWCSVRCLGSWSSHFKLLFFCKELLKSFALVQMEFIVNCAFQISFKTKAHKCCPKVRKKPGNPSPIINLFPSLEAQSVALSPRFLASFSSFAGIEKQCHESIQPALFFPSQPVLDCNSGRMGVWAIVWWQGGRLLVCEDCALVCTHAARHIFL